MATEQRLIDANKISYHPSGFPKGDGFDSRLDWAFRENIDKLPTVDAVALPCKIGDTAWGIRCYRGALVPRQGKVSEMLFTADMKLSIVIKHICRGEWGKKVFATREEAERAIAERRPHEKT